jgi:hypothetical protein
MLKLRVVQARYGDSLILESGTGKRRKYILVDGGPGGVFGPYLSAELKKIAAEGGRLERVVLTHIDEDHVAGLLEFMESLQAAKDQHQPPMIAVGGMWHNGFSKIVPEEAQAAADLEFEMMSLPDVSGPLEEPAAPSHQPLSEPEESPEAGMWSPALDYGVKEGHQLQLIDAELDIQRNEGFPGQLVTVESAPRPLKLAGMRIWILGPTQANLNKLHDKWLQWLTKEGISFGVPGAQVKPDSSEANLSSIMFLAEVGKRRIIMTGDGLGDDVVAGLEQCGLMPPGGTFHVDILKLPHHGSARNVVGRLLDHVLADTYVISADGKYGNPDWQTLNWLIDMACRQQRDIHIFATNPTPSLDRLVRERPPESNNYHLTIMPRGVLSVEL